MSSGFWSQRQEALKQQDVVLQTSNEPFEEMDLTPLTSAQEELEQTQEESDEQDMMEVLSNANLRLEQGHLYKMIIDNNIFENMDADPKAVRNVQKEIRNYARERMEIMLGMRQEQAKTQEVIVSSPFNELEVITLKTIAAQMSKGATIKADKPQSPPVPKKENFTPISGTTKRETLTPIQESKPLPKNRTAPVAPKPTPAKESALQVPALDDETLLTKPISEMSPEELIEYEKKSSLRQQRLKSALPPGMVPMPSPAAQEALYQSRLNEVLSRPGSAMSGMLGVLTKR